MNTINKEKLIRNHHPRKQKRKSQKKPTFQTHQSELLSWCLGQKCHCDVAVLQNNMILYPTPFPSPFLFLVKKRPYKLVLGERQETLRNDSFSIDHRLTLWNHRRMSKSFN